MATLTLRIPKGSPLTNAELDANFVELDNTKVQLGGDIGGTTSTPVVISLRGRSVSTAAPTTGQALVWTGTAWEPQAVALGGGTTSISVSSNVVSLPAFSAYASNAELQTITFGSQQKVKFQLEEFDTANCYSNSRFTPNVAGYYQINAQVRFDGNASTSNEIMISLWKNGAEYKRGWNSTGVSPGTNWFSMQVNSLVYFNGSTDYVEVYAQHGNSSNSLTITGVNQTGITWFNGTMIPTTVLSSVAVTGTAGAANIVVLNDISNFFNRKRKVFTLKSGQTAIVEGVNYRDNRDFSVIIGGRYFYAEVPQISTLGPWIVDYVAGRTYEFKVTGSKLIFYREIFDRQSAEIRINNVSASRQKRSRYPFSANSIVLGE